MQCFCSLVESNDTLYGSDPKYLKEIDKIGCVILEEILSLMKQMGAGKKRSETGLELLTRIFTRGDINCQALQNLSKMLWNNIVKDGSLDVKYIVSILNYWVE